MNFNKGRKEIKLAKALAVLKEVAPDFDDLIRFDLADDDDDEFKENQRQCRIRDIEIDAFNSKQEKAKKIMLSFAKKGKPKFNKENSFTLIIDEEKSEFEGTIYRVDFCETEKMNKFLENRTWAPTPKAIFKIPFFMTNEEYEKAYSIVWKIQDRGDGRFYEGSYKELLIEIRAAIINACSDRLGKKQIRKILSIFVTSSSEGNRNENFVTKVILNEDNQAIGIVESIKKQTSKIICAHDASLTKNGVVPVGTIRNLRVSASAMKIKNYLLSANPPDFISSLSNNNGDCEFFLLNKSIK